MTPIIRFNTIVIGITTVFIFGIWLGISKLILTYPEWFIDPDKNIYNLLGVILTGLISIGIYRIVLSILSLIINNCLPFKKLIFGSSFLEGTWVGFYIGVSGNERFLIESFEQRIDGMIIRGKSFNEVENFHSTWIADTINVDSIRGKISYQYKVESPTETSDHNGIACFNFERKKQNKAPDTLIGFSADLHLTKKCKAMEFKISENTTYDLEKALALAKEFYNKNKNHFFKQ